MEQLSRNHLSSINQYAVGAAGLSILLVLLGRCLARPAQSSDRLKVEALYVYPVKGIRGCSLDKAKIGQFGFEGDRTFCLQKVHRDADTKKVTFETMFIGYDLRLALFRTALEDLGKEKNIVVTWTGDGNTSAKLSWTGSENQIRFPLQPDPKALEPIEVNLHGSPTLALDMGEEFTTFFSRHLGFEVRLAYIGQYSRAVLGSIAPNSKAALSRASLPTRILAQIPLIGRPVERIVFNDIAQYLVVTKESNDEVSSRLAEGQEMDVTKFRPNVVVSGSADPFAEDFWAELTFAGDIKMALTANCYRCQSITVDYATGKACEDDRGQVWKKLNKDRRVDTGAKYSPVFGRYGFCRDADRGREISIGAELLVTKKNASRTIFDWPSLANFGTS
ncbi:hypothetical protein LTS15_006580 [Exophiala xenobiotica]|nr:hypothetical protein LTS15_006580 [Exophiala xenobiotica]